MAFVCSGYFNRDVENFVKTSIDVVSIFRATRPDLIQAPHCFEVGRAMFEDPKQSCFTLAQFLRALGDLFFEAVLGLAQLLFESFLCSEISDNDTDGVGLGLEFGKRQKHGNFPAVARTELVLAFDCLLARPFDILKKLIAQVRDDEVAEWNPTRPAFIQPENTRKISIAIENVRIRRNTYCTLIHLID